MELLGSSECRHLPSGLEYHLFLLFYPSDSSPPSFHSLFKIALQLKAALKHHHIAPWSFDVKHLSRFCCLVVLLVMNFDTCEMRRQEECMGSFLILDELIVCHAFVVVGWRFLPFFLPFFVLSQISTALSTCVSSPWGHRIQRRQRHDLYHPSGCYCWM